MLFSFWFDNKVNEYTNVQRIAFSDCLIRNRFQYNYVYTIDVDELPVLRKHDSLPALVKDQSKRCVF